MLATAHSAALQGIEAEAVLVEVNTGEAGAPDLILVGLPDAAVKESEDRVFSALSNSGFHMPRTRTTINLAPGDIRKGGGGVRTPPRRRPALHPAAVAAGLESKLRPVRAGRRFKV